MGKKRCITEAQVMAAFNLAIRNGSHEWCDNYGNVIRYTVENWNGETVFTIKKEGSLCGLDMGTFGELFRNSITADACRLCYFDKSTGKTVYSEWHEVVVVNNPNHPLYGALVRREDGYIIANSDEKLF